MKGPAAGMPRPRRIRSKPAAATSTGTGQNQIMWGRLNQRCAICGGASGGQRLSTAMTASSASGSGRAMSHMWRCNRPSVFMISQVQPSSAYPARTPRPVKSENGLIQSPAPP
ncbi:hypothetical protein G6F55_014272 [Rhizopus delemar]|nr:hypothetical protein G6F55_014272 [Rhizopus delemar]